MLLRSPMQQLRGRVIRARTLPGALEPLSLEFGEGSPGAWNPSPKFGAGAPCKALLGAVPHEIANLVRHA